MGGNDKTPSRKKWWRAVAAAVAAFLVVGLGTGPADDPDKDIGD
jgi:hypothetical protein